MSARALALVLLSLASCKKQEEPAAAAAAPLDRRGRCEKIGDQIAQMGLLFARGLVSGLSEGKQQLGEHEQAELRTELATAKLELLEKCMGWPEETLDCFGAAGVLNAERCDRLLAETLGEAVPPEAPPGPPPAWSFTLPHDLELLFGCADGSVLALLEGEDEGAAPSLVAVADGKQRWARPLSGEPWSVERLDDEHALLVMPRELVAISIADGVERWRAALPAGDDQASMIALLREGERMTVLDDGRRVLQVELARCPKGACTEKLGTLATDDPESHIGLDLSGPIELARLPDGGLVITSTEEHRIAVLDEQLHLRFAIESRAAMSWARWREGALVVAQDGELLGLDPAACGSASKTYAPSTWPPPGKPDWLREVTVREGDWAETPPGCVAWRRPLTIAELADAPVDGFDEAMIVQAGGFLFALDASSERWKSSVAAESLAVRHGDAIAVLGDVGSGDTELALMWLSPQDGKHVARTRLALGKGEYFVLDGPQLVAAGKLAVAGYARELVAFGQTR
ncbi:MAG: PQQ-binding-like beta-propeller repeat protein [Deltaproteobacteria bacterium]|nr:PQQ-binding-like beta-propeller repeat protein [Nannocystaceae bacterium]